MQRKNNHVYNTKLYGSIVKLNGKRAEPFGVRLTLGYNEKGYPVYEFLDTFDNELDAELCRREYSKNPYDLIINHEKYISIKKSSALPSKVIDESTVIVEEDKTGYTFKQIYDEWKEIYFPTKEQIKEEEITHKKAKGKLSKANKGNMSSAFSNSKKLHDRIYSTLRKIDFETVINETNGCRTKLYNMRNLYIKLDEYAYEKNIIDKCYADKVHVDYEENETGRHPYTYKEIEFLWSLEAEKDVDILLVLLYNCMRIDELLSLETSNIFFDKGYMVGGLKSESGKNRIIPIHHRIKHIIEKYYNSNNKYLFTDENGNKIKYKDYYYRFKILRTKWGEKNFDQTHVVHETRHSIRSEMDRRGANKKCMDLLMGHKSTDVGNRVYNIKTIQELKDTIELVSYKETEIIELKSNKELSKTI